MWIGHTARNAEGLWAMGLLERGVVRSKWDSLAVVPHMRYRAGSPDLSTATRERLEAARLAGFPDPRTAALAALAAAVGVVDRLHPGWGARHERAPMRRLARKSWIASAVRRSIRWDMPSSRSSGGDGGGGGCGSSDGGGGHSGSHGCGGGGGCGGGCGGGGD